VKQHCRRTYIVNAPSILNTTQLDEVAFMQVVPMHFSCGTGMNFM
jgi:hypothetical protein